MSTLARHVICFLGRWESFDQLNEVLASTTGFELSADYSETVHDPRMEAAFEMWFDRIVPTVKPEDRSSIINHSAVAYVMSPSMERGTGEIISGEALRLTARVLEHSALAAKSESAGVAHGKQHWIELGRSYEKGVENG